MKILFLTANPKGTNALQLDEEAKKIEDGLERSKLRDQFMLVTKWAVDAETLRRAMLKEQPDIVHFSGHGEGKAGLVLVGQDGKPKPATADALAGLFEIFQNVKCVLLNACYAEVQAQAIVQHIDYVIGMKEAVRDDAAIAFATGFYDGLGYGLGIEDAFRLGRNAIQFELASFSATTRKLIPVDFEGTKEKLEPLAEHLIPVLLKREATPSDSPASLTTPTPVHKSDFFEEVQRTKNNTKAEVIQQYRERVKEFLVQHELTPMAAFQLATLANVLKLSENEVNQIVKEEQNKIKLEKQIDYKKQNIPVFKNILSSNSSWIRWLLLVLFLLGVTTVSVKFISAFIHSNSNVQQKIPLESDVGINYELLQKYLIASDWKNADIQTMSNLLEIANKIRPIRNPDQSWLEPKDIRELPCNDLRTINQLWSNASKNRWGFIAQSRIWQRVGGTTQTEPDNSDVRRNFSMAVGWPRADVGQFDLDTLYEKLNNNPLDKHPEGYLPSAIGKYKNRQIWVGQLNEFAALTARLKECEIFKE